MPENTETLDLDLHIDKPPDAVRRWWTDLPDDYRAEDPREQPYRIRTLRRFDGGRDLHTFWRNPDGSEFELKETMRVQDDRHWTFDIAEGLGYRIHDEFHAEPEGTGTHLHIHSDVTQVSDNPALPIDALVESMREGWPEDAKICERDA